jgi:hypothetical protein
MRRIILIGFLVVCSLFVVDYTIATLQSRALSSRLGSEDILRTLNELIEPGMSRAETERQLDGFREARLSPSDAVDDEYSVSYRYWFGLIPPFGAPEFKLIGAVDVVYSKDWHVKESHYWVN